MSQKRLPKWRQQLKNGLPFFAEKAQNRLNNVWRDFRLPMSASGMVT